MATIKQIASQLNISISTVSRALNGKKGVSEALREKISVLSKELGYYPDSNATALVNRKIGVIGVVIPRESDFVFTNPYFPRILLGINETVNKEGYNILLSIGQEIDYMSLYFRKLVDGLLIVGHRVDDQRIFELEKNLIPSVLIPGFPAGKGPDIISVDGENFQSVYRTVNYLCGLGHKKIAFILGALNSKYSIERLAAFRQVMENNKIAIDDRYLLESDFSTADGSRLMGKLLDMRVRPTAVLLISDAVALGGIMEIKRRKIRIPQDISIVAIGGSDVLDGIDPSITAINMSPARVGEKAAEILIKNIEGELIKNRRVVIPSDLIIRESTDVYQKSG